MKRFFARIPMKNKIALALLVLSLLMTALPWVNISAGIMGQRYSLPKLIDMNCQMRGITRAQYDLESQSAISELALELAEETGVVLDASRTTQMVNRIMDGGLTVLDGATISTYTSVLMGKINRVYRSRYANLTAESVELLQLLQQIANSFTVSAVMLWAVVIVLLVAFGFAVYTLLQGKKSGILVYTVAVTIPVIVLITCVANANGALQFYSDTVSDILAGSFSFFDANNTAGMDMRLLRLTAAPFLCLLLAVGAMVLTFMKEPAESNSGDRCACGAPIVPGMRYCTRCGRVARGMAEARTAAPEQRTNGFSKPNNFDLD